LPTEFSDNISVEQISFLIKVESWFLFKKKKWFLYAYKGTNQNSIEYRSFKKKPIFAVPSLDAIMENLRHNREWGR
jgi:hypothetical protein